MLKRPATEHFLTSLSKKRCLSASVSEGSESSPNFNNFGTFTGIKRRRPLDDLFNTGFNGESSNFGDETRNEASFGFQGNFTAASSGAFVAGNGLDSNEGVKVFEMFKKELEQMKGEASRRFNKIQNENGSLRRELKINNEQNEKLSKENKLLRVGLSSLNTKLQGCKCNEMAATIQTQRETIQYLEQVTFNLRCEMRRLEGAMNPASMWEGKSNGDGHVY